MIVKSALSALALSSLLVACKKDDKKDNTSANTDTSGSTTVAQSIAGSYTAVTDQLGKINIIKATGLKLNETGTVTQLTDLSSDPWDAALWNGTQVFNCFGECPASGSGTPAYFVQQGISQKNSQSPMGKVANAVSSLCTLNLVFAGESGLPAAGTQTIHVDAAFRAKLATACPGEGNDDGAQDFDAIVTVTDVNGAGFDKKIEFTIGGQTAFATYLRNNGKEVNIGNYEAREAGINRTIVSYDLAAKTFRFELVGIDAPGDMQSSFNFYRGFIDSATGEVRFSAIMGSNYKVGDVYQNLSFLTVNGNSDQDSVGATMSRQSNYASFENKFVCFNRTNMEFINNTGCVGTTSDRKSNWTYTSDLFKTIAAKSYTEFHLTENTKIQSFDATTMFSAEPNY